MILYRSVLSAFLFKSSFIRTASVSNVIHNNEEENKLLQLVNQLTEYKARPGRQHQTSLNQLERLHQLVMYLGTHPPVAMETARGIIPSLLKFRQVGPLEIRKQVNMALSLLGHPPPYKGKGLRILSIDGGGTRGLIPIILLQHLEELCGQKISDMFDYVAGTSTGTLISTLVFVERLPVKEIEVLYKELSTKIFKMNNLLGIGQLFLTQSFYDSSLLMKQVRRFPVTEKKFYETSSDDTVPKMSFVSTLVNQEIIQPFLFTNYRQGTDPSHYLSMSDATVWQSIMASTAAPGYFEEVKIGPYILQDGGILTNNPSAIALHETRHLWGKGVPIQSLISLGTGQYVYDDRAVHKDSSNTISLKEKLTKIVASATDTQAVHTILQDLLPHDSYFRFNPILSAPVALDNSKPHLLQMLVNDTHQYIRTNQSLLQQAVNSLTKEKSFTQKLLNRLYNK